MKSFYEKIRRWIHFPGFGLILVLVLLILAINALALWGIFYTAEEARTTAVEHLRSQTLANARALEAILTSCRNDFLFLSKSAPLKDFERAISGEDPMVRRWHRIDMEATLLLFVSAHPEVEWISLRDGNGRIFLSAGRRAGAPVLLSPNDFGPAGEQGRFLLGEWPLGDQARESGVLGAALRVSRLIEMAAPAEASRLSLERAERVLASWEVGPKGDRVISAVVRDDVWNPPVRWMLLRTEPDSGLVNSISQLGDRYRSTLILNVGLMTLAFLLGVIVFWQVRRSLLLEAQYRQQARIRELERQLMHQERLVTVGRLAAGLAHEINNPLEGMSNYLRLAEDEVKEDHREDALTMISKAREGLLGASAITRQVLTFADPAEAPKTDLDVQDLVIRTIRFIEGNPLFRESSIRFSSREKRILIQGNAVTLGQLFLNLMLNACQQASGAHCVEITSEIHGSEVVISVSDDGPGIPEDALPRIFEPFFSTRGSTGLGLSVCLGIVRQHGGRIDAGNRPEGGAIFAVHLPLPNDRREGSGSRKGRPEGDDNASGWMPEKEKGKYELSWNGPGRG